MFFENIKITQNIKPDINRLKNKNKNKPEENRKKNKKYRMKGVKR